MVSTLYVVIILVAVALVAAVFLYWRSQHIKAEKPTAPSDLQLVSVPNIEQDCSAWQAQLRWTASEGAPPTTYKWSLSRGGQVVASGTSVKPESTLLTDKQLSNNTTYQAEVVASNSFGTTTSGKVSLTTGSAVVIDQSTLTHLNDPTNGYLVVIANTEQPIDPQADRVNSEVFWSSKTGQGGIGAEYIYTSTTQCLVEYAINAIEQGNTIAGFVVTSGSQSWTYTRHPNNPNWVLGTTQLNGAGVVNSVEQNISQLSTGSIAFTATPTQPFAVISNGQLCLGTCPTENTLAFVFPTDASLTTGTAVTMMVLLQTAWTGQCSTKLQFTA